ncbi:E3 ubiquitin-protein ligase TRIM71-like [Ptychodera flava]|uniref:E3 ubiquitin-protein ligase TRIM71-like n=1 Tax=Ptychodera flava TaxID=63121 RepID=UPI00396A9F45
MATVCSANSHDANMRHPNQEDGDKRLAEIRGEYDKRKVHLNSQIKELEIIEDNVVIASEYAENRVHYRDASQLMIAKKGLDTNVRELLALKTVVDTVEDDYMLFQPCGDFCKEKKLGMLETTRTLYKLADIPTFVRINGEISLTMEALHETSQIKCNGKIKQVDVVVTSPGNVQEKMAVFSNNNGTLTLKTRAKMEGVHEVSAFMHEKPGTGKQRGPFSSPWFVCTDSKGNVYVSDKDNNRIQVFDGYCRFRYTFGSEGSGDGQLKSPSGVAVDKRGYMYVSDSGNNRIVKYKPGGKFLCRVDSDSNGLSSPQGICLERKIR